MYVIYWLISETRNKTYIGFTDNIIERVKKHKNRSVKTTKDFGKFKCYILEKIDNLENAIKREKYWKSSSGRKKLKLLFESKINGHGPIV